MREHTAQVFISYASADAERVSAIVAELEAHGVGVWRDRDRILGGDNFGLEIVAGIERCQVVLLMCSERSLQSRNVKQEIMLAWELSRPLIPLLIDAAIEHRYPRELQYWLQGFQWIDAGGRDSRWLGKLLAALASNGVHCEVPDGYDEQTHVPRLRSSFAALRGLAAFTDRIFPVRVDPAFAPNGTRDLNASPERAAHRFRLGDYVRLVLQPAEAGYLTLIDEGTSGQLHCLSPSSMVPQRQVAVEPTAIPDPDLGERAFLISGDRGREQLLAIVTKEPLQLPFVASSSAPPAELSVEEVDALTDGLRSLPRDGWTAYSTHFDVIP